MDYDKPLNALFLGVIATIPYEIFTRVMVSLGFGKYTVYQLSSLTVTLNRPTAGIGIVTSSIVGGISAFILYRSLKKLDSDYIIIKGLITGIISWVVTELIYTWLIEGRGFANRPVSDYYLELAGAVLFGITLGLLFQRFIVRSLDKNRLNKTRI